MTDGNYKYKNVFDMVDADKENQTLIMKDEVPLSYRNIAKLSFQLGITRLHII